MKLIGVVWNSVEENWKDVISDIKEYGKIEQLYSIDFGDDFENFIKELYPYSPEEQWKAKYKICGLLNQYDNNVVHIVVMDLPKLEKVFLKQKNKDMYKNVLDLKVSIRHKYRYLLKPNSLDKDVSYDNVFHMTDDELEYNENVFSILPFLIRHSITNSPFVLDPFVDVNNIKQEKNGTRKAYWITPTVMFKEETNGTYESYSELFNYYFMQRLGINNSCYYGLAQYNGKQGVITKHIANKNEEMFLGSGILNSYGIFDKKDLIYYNSLDLLPIVIKKFCSDNNYIYDETIQKDFEKLFVYDLIMMQSDRNPSNWALVCDKKTRKIRMFCFDHSNMLFFDNADAIERFSCGQLDVCNYINNDITTFLIRNSNNIEMCHKSKSFHIQDFLENATVEQKNLLDAMLSTIDEELILETFAQIEKENNCVLPQDFKDALLQGFNFSKCQIDYLAEQVNSLRSKKLCKKK